MAKQPDLCLCHFYAFKELPVEIRKDFYLLDPAESNEHFKYLQQLGVFFYRTSLKKYDNKATLIQPLDTPESYSNLLKMTDFVAFKYMFEADERTGKITTQRADSSEVMIKNKLLYSDTLAWLAWGEKKFIKRFNESFIQEV